jgi:hypothetical protein
MKNSGSKSQDPPKPKSGTDQPAAPSEAQTAAPGASVATADPLLSGGNVNTKAYSGAGASGDYSPEEMMADIPEFTPPPPSGGAKTADGGPATPGMDDYDDEEESGSGSKKKEKKSFNPDMEDLSDAEKKSAAEKMAQGIMTGYKFLNNQGERLLKISDKKIAKLQMQGDIDVSLTVPWDMNQMISLGDYFSEYNKQCDGIFVVDKDFESSVMPPLTRVLAKRGHGWSDEHYLMFMFGQDVLRKGMQFREIKSSLNQILHFAKEQTELQRRVPTQQVVHQPAPPQEPPQYAHQPETVVHQPPPAPPRTMQERAIQNADITTAKTKSGLPQYGTRGKVKRINQAAHVAENAGKPVKNPRTAAKEIIDKSKRKVQELNPIPSGEKKGRGRPPGSKNKPKLP